jgi:uncharacterized membrane protein HdeD (DUF308 family)
MKKISKAKKASLIVSLATVLLGIVLILWPGSSVELICRILGICVLIFGAAKLIGYFSDDVYRSAFRFDLVLGIFSAILGLVLIFRPDTIISLAHILVGVYVFIEGVFKVQSAVDAKRMGVSGWWALAVGAAVTVIVGLVLVFFPFDAAKTVVRAIGIALIIEGAESFFAAICAAEPANKEDISAEYRDIS